ncbi:fungal-specific transcription factor domain-containing protein [Fusarium avenaceum]|nr:fungal-specific transcription factor domain-containing protein [Fusarium avenaceum]
MPVFSCSQCPKEFTSQGSLARHENNHAHSAKHVCHVCGVIFRRRDLLTRHMKIHGPDLDSEDEAGGDPDTQPAADKNKTQNKSKGKGRRRCHTACNRCRDMKIKCDGLYPCAKCRAAQNPCVFQHTATGRRSQVLTSLDVTEEGTTPGNDQDCFDGFSQSLADSNPSTDQGEPDASAAFQLESTTAADATFWPWLHEGLFLSDDSLGLLSAFGSADHAFVGDPFSFPGFTAAGLSASASAPCDTSQLCADWITTPATATTPFGLRPPIPSNANDSRPVAGPGALSPPGEDGVVDATSSKQQAIDELVALASQQQGSSAHFNLWSSATSDLVKAFDFGSDLEINSNSNVSLKRTTEALNYFVKLYTDHFHPLWPMLHRQTLATGNLHPVLYLVLTSIGAMYLGPVGAQYGVMMHNTVRRHLVMFLEMEIIQDSLVWLAQARLLTQVAALYFGQPMAFSYAQHLGTLLTSQARRMCLFSGSVHRQRVSQFTNSNGIAQDAERLELWLAIEERRRLAFGIFRGGIFTSVLLNTKPLVTLDEIDLEFPCCDAVWSGQNLDPRVALEMIEHDCTPSRDMRASDIYFILLERDEILPPLEPVAHELLLFGLQSLIWRFSYDRQIAQTLGPETILEPDQNSPPGQDDCSPPKKRRRRDTFASEAESLDARSYEMSDLLEERCRLMEALSKWERALALAKSFARTDRDRSYILSGLILYHMSFLRLYAPVEDIHQIHYRASDKRPIPKDLVLTTKAWASTPKAQLALDKVRMIWTLITQQSQLGKARSKFNFNAFIGLHHGAAVLWAYNGIKAAELGSHGQVSAALHHGDNTSITEILKSLLELFHQVSPARWSSFADITVPNAEFPTDLTLM